MPWRLSPAAHAPPPYYAGNPKQITPTPRAYPYGYFGAQYRPYSVIHKGYYNHFNQWSYRRGY